MHTAAYTAPPTECPRKTCRALAGQPCRDRSGRVVKPHSARLLRVKAQEEGPVAVKPLSEGQRKYISDLRRNLGLAAGEMPLSSKEGVFLIKSLIARQAMERVVAR